MKSVFYLLSLGAILLAGGSARTFAQCGVERWSVKTGTDQDASLLNLGSKTSTTITSLLAITAPNPIPDDRRVQPTETTVWVLNATLKKYVRAYDSDYHMVLADDAGHTMIAEIPDQIGRASCRERGWISAVAVSIKKKRETKRQHAL